jgi:ABC-type dipeptide/oligopeptide/nickel transport system permease component
MRGTDFVLKRILFAVGTVFVAITLNFVLFRMLSGDAVSALRCQHCTPQFKAYERKTLGLDQSKPEQYWLYVDGLFHGDMGRSLRTQEPVWQTLWVPLKNTMPMVALGTIFSVVLGIITGVIAAWRRGTWTDKTSVWASLVWYSLPPQWLGLMIVLFVAGAVGLPTSGIHDPTLGILGDPSTWQVFVDRMKHMVLPAATLGLVLYGNFTLIVRSAMLETLGEDYVLTARAKGLSSWATVWKHGLRNAMLPVITLIALSLGFIIGGTITIEYVFSYPGIGLATVEAIDQRDYPILQGIFLLLTFSVIFFNLVADLLYFKLDPRVSE